MGLVAKTSFASLRNQNMGTPQSGALGGSRECNSLSQRRTLFVCEIKNKGN
ncbi:hypothetical protein [Campylobacter lanienae]|uniref:hypothetical protein n=1 Tax=Campylobacter lanienae TaxID=75658 RepID=UPI002430FCA6|nr:hypothetical protein [Campylobacter lanienae]MDD5787008.1 hypothetical protein [Campylobacter lanienae]